MADPAPSAPPRPQADPAGTAARWLRDPWRATLVLVGALTVVRIAILFATSLELYPDEAQYWLWSRRLDWGYFSKPPMIAWLIRATTAAGGDGEAWVRLSAPLLHGAAALALHRAGARLFGPAAGFRAAAIYILMPGVQLSSTIIATDAPLLAFLAAALWALAAMWSARGEGGRRIALALGAALGLACLSKYAGLYLAGGLAAHALVDGEGRARLWSPGRAAAALGAFAVVVAPNVAWNLAHHLQTVVHTVANADLGGARPAGGFDPRGALGFLLGQFVVFGPLPFAALLIGAAGALRSGRLPAAQRLVASLAAPALLIVLGEAAAVRANANWAAAAYPASALLAGAWLSGGGRARWLAAGLAVQAAGIAAFAAAVISPAAAQALHVDNSLKTARGWRASARVAHAHLARSMIAGPVTALAVDDRAMFNALAYYGRGWVGAPGGAPLRMWVHEARARNQAEAAAPLRAEEGARVAFVSTAWPRESRWDFRRVDESGVTGVRLDSRRTRPIQLYVGEGFAPRPRDPATGLPVAP